MSICRETYTERSPNPDSHGSGTWGKRRTWTFLCATPLFAPMSASRCYASPVCAFVAQFYPGLQLCWTAVDDWSTPPKASSCRRDVFFALQLTQPFLHVNPSARLPHCSLYAYMHHLAAVQRPANGRGGKHSPIISHTITAATAWFLCFVPVALFAPFISLGFASHPYARAISSSRTLVDVRCALSRAVQPRRASRARRGLAADGGKFWGR